MTLSISNKLTPNLLVIDRALKDVCKSQTACLDPLIQECLSPGFQPLPAHKSEQIIRLWENRYNLRLFPINQKRIGKLYYSLQGG